MSCRRLPDVSVKRAAGVRGLDAGDYVRFRILPPAQQEIEEAESGVLRLPREALQNPPPPTEAQRELGALVRSVM